MKIGINASFLRKQNTGIGQVTLNFLRKLSESQVAPKSSATGQASHKSQDLEFILYLEEDVELELPDNFHKKAFLPKRYKRDDIFRAIWWQAVMLPREAKKDGCDVFLSMYQSATVMPEKIKHLMIVHDIILEFFPNYLNNWRKKFLWLLTKRAIRKTDRIVSVSKRTEKDLIHNLRIDPKRITVSYIATDEIYKKDVSETESRMVLEKYGLEKGYIYAGGGLEVRKNVEGTLRAYKILLDQNRDMFAKLKNIPALVISGKLMPELAPLVTDAEALVKSMEMEGRVKLLGFVPQEDLPVLYKNAVLFSYPSFYEGFGLPVLEAMCQGVPVITAKGSSLPEVGGDSVLYCDPSDVEEIARVMKKILLDGNLRQTLSERGKKRSGNFSWDRFASKILNMMREM
ncbi:MAG: Glycosyl transferase group 1 [Parcubacteria group bacterium GW2011_GWC1_45_14]|nr:MAG: Glycosyl transferase group 1 [Candidatus Moranbacteria bacterium GW2011_GWC2_45_10]KKT94024.1 MAG: Glycosyl transferase group 1 [Parcubacteria group bacterium GW2011_GWC1_45_14]